MTGSEMVYQFQQLLTTVSPAFHEGQRLKTYEILDYLNRTVDRYIVTKYLNKGSFKANTASLRASIDDLGELVLTSDTNAVFVAMIGLSGVYTSALPSNFMAYIKSDSLITRTTVLPCNSKWVVNKEIDYSDIDNVVETPFNRPILEAPLVTMQGTAGTIKGQLITVVDYHTDEPESNLVTYIKKPSPIDMTGDDCELAKYLHEEIVKLAVSMYIDEYKMRLKQPDKSK